LSGVSTAKSLVPSGEIAIGRPCRVSKVRKVLWALASGTPSESVRHAMSDVYTRLRDPSRRPLGSLQLAVLSFNPHLLSLDA
jgi:hypothetical protein